MTFSRMLHAPETVSEAADASSADNTSGAADTSAETRFSGFTVLLFASLKDAVQTSSISVVAAEPRVSVADLLRLCGEQFPALSPYLPYVRVAVNFEYSNNEQSVSFTDEIAFLPPVSGGSVETFQPEIAITHEKIDSAAVALSVQRCWSGGAGAILTFEGIVRDNAQNRAVEYLEYFAYEAMALRTLQQVSDEVKERWDLPCAIVHRLGRLEIGEASVVIAVASPHRAPSFESVSLRHRSSQRDRADMEKGNRA